MLSNRTPCPGKFEGCADDRLGQALYNISGDGYCDSIGDVNEVGLWAALVLGKRLGKPSYIVTEDDYGFVDYATYATAGEATIAFEALQSALYPEGEE